MPWLNADQLKKLCDEAYVKYPTSCSHAVWYVMNGATHPPRALPTYRQANQLIAYLNSSPMWSKVVLSKIGDYARAGTVVVGGATAAGNGHVIVVYPGPDRAAGGYDFTKDGKTKHVSLRGSYAPALSTSMGTWPGAMSKGDKTVWDPWGSDDAFRAVTFWAQVGDLPTGATS